MGKWIKLSRGEGETHVIFVNFDRALAIRPRKGGSIVHFSADFNSRETIEVNETPEEIFKKAGADA